MNKEQIDKAFAKIESETSEKANEHLFLFVKQILVLTTTLLGILISFSDKNPESQTEIILFIITLSLLGLCILLALTILYERPKNYNLLRIKIYEHKQSLYLNQKTESKIFAPFSRTFLKKVTIYYASFVGSIVFLILYGSFAIHYDFKANQKNINDENKIDLLIQKTDSIERKLNLIKSDTIK